MTDTSTAIDQKARAWPKRYSVVGACFFVMFISYVDRVNISVAAVAMQDALDWSESRKGFVLSSFFIGYMFMQIIGGWLANILGGRRVLIVSLVLCSLCTAFTPLAAHASFLLLIAVRIGLGLTEAPINPSVYNIFSRWVPEAERARSVALYSSAGFLGTFTALALTGWAVEKFGWESPFYAFGLLGLAYALVLRRIVTGDPPGTGLSETAAAARKPGSIAAAGPVPWGRLLSQAPFWALVFTFFCTSWIFYVLLSWMPSYFASVHGLPVARSGYYSMVSWLVMFLLMNAAGWASDSLVRRGWTTTRTRKCMTSIGLFGAGLMLVLIPRAGSPEQALTLFSFTLGFLALAYSSEAPNVLDIAPRYADVLFGILNTFGSIPGVIGVALTGILIQATGAYDSVFWIAGTLALSGGLVFLLFGTGRKLVD